MLVSLAIVLNSQFQSDSRSLLFWNVTQRRLIVRYRRFGTIYWYNLQGSTSTGIGVMSSFKVPVTGPSVRNSAMRVNFNPDKDLIPFAGLLFRCFTSEHRTRTYWQCFRICLHAPSGAVKSNKGHERQYIWRVRVTFITPRLF